MNFFFFLLYLFRCPCPILFFTLFYPSSFLSFSPLFLVFGGKGRLRGLYVEIDEMGGVIVCQSRCTYWVDAVDEMMTSEHDGGDVAEGQGHDCALHCFSCNIYRWNSVEMICNLRQKDDIRSELKTRSAAWKRVTVVL